jgi:predicted PurR-regulated permease PerM
VRVFSRGQRRLRPFAIAAAYVVVIAALIIPAMAALTPAVRDVRNLSTALEDYSQRVREWSEGDLPGSLQRLPAAIRPPIDHVTQGTSDLLRSLGRGLMTATLAFMMSLATALGAGALILVISVFLLSDKEYLKDSIFRLIPRAYHADADALLGRIDTALSALIRGQVVICLAIAMALWTGLTLLHVRYAALLATFTGIAQLIPEVGATVGLVAAVTTAAFQGFWPAVETAALFLGVYQLASRVLGPWVMSQAVQIHPLVIILATTCGAILGGVVGAILAIPVTAVAKVVLAFAYERLSPRFGPQGPAQS